MLLAVETSGMQGSIALHDNNAIIAERILLSGGVRHAQSLVSEVDRMLQELTLKPADVRSVAVSIGPGSFTGLRVGVVFAKTFAWLHHTELAAVDTLQAIAQQAGQEIASVTAVIDAQKSEVFAGTYRWNSVSGCRELVSPVRVCGVQSLPTDHPLTGPALTRIRSNPDLNFQYLDESLWEAQARTVAHLGSCMIANRTLAIPETLEPVYLRASYAEEKRDGAAGSTALPK